MMTRKDFEIVAGELRACRPVEFTHDDRYNAGYMSAVAAVGDALAEINPRFDRDRFTQAVLKEVAPCSID